MTPRTLWQRLRPGERRVLAIGLGVMLAGWLALRVAPRVVRVGAALHERAAVATVTLERARAALAQAPLARESLATRAARLVSQAPRLFGGATSSEAAAELASLVSGEATMHRVRIVRQDAKPDSIASLFLRLTLRLEAEGDAEGIGGWIAALEESPRLVDVQAVSLTAPDPAAPIAQPERLRVELVLIAWAVVRRPRQS